MKWALALPCRSRCRVSASWGATPPTVRQQFHEFKPTAFYNEFSATTPPVLRVEPGDTISDGDNRRGWDRLPRCDSRQGWQPADPPRSTSPARHLAIRLRSTSRDCG